MGENHKCIQCRFLTLGLTHIDVDYQYPAYTEFQPITQYNNGNLEGIDGTFATIRLTTNKTIANAVSDSTKMR